jgi:hypothetical protein
MTSGGRFFAGAGIVAALLLVLTACGAQEPVADGKGFQLQSGDTRAYAAYRQTSSDSRHTVRLRAGTQHVRVRTDCIGKGEITVKVFGGSIGSPCHGSSAPGGSISMTKLHAMSTAGSTEVVVHVRKGVVWSAAVDVGPGKIEP